MVRGMRMKRWSIDFKGLLLVRHSQETHEVKSAGNGLSLDVTRDPEALEGRPVPDRH
jgi:hypothetical protein